MSRILDDHITGTQDAAAVSAPVKARLKWFNGPKGFGFVNPVDREEVDAFLHITTLQRAGVQAIGDGACLLCDIEYGDKGAHVREIIDVLDTGMVQQPLARPGKMDDRAGSEVHEMEGTVKWYKPDQGFGFVTPDDGMKDVFIHKSCLDRHDIEELQSGQRLAMTFRNVPKGREVITFSIIED